MAATGSSRRLEVHPDIAQAATISAAVYSDPAYFALAKERIFATSWQFVGDTDLVKVPGQVHPFTLLEGCLDEPLLLTRDMDDGVHLLSNVCTHRGNIVCQAGGREKHLTCCYHGRRFGLDGCFKHMPEFEGTKNFPTAADDLPRVRFGTWGRFVFASLAPDEELEKLLAPITERLGWLRDRDFVFDGTRSKDYLVRCNWALYCENYLEGFHIPFVHASLNAALDYGSYTTELYDRCVLQLGVAKGGEETFVLPAGSPDSGKNIAAYYYWLFPNTMLNFYPWGLSVNVVRPLAHNVTRVSFLTYVTDPSRLDTGAGAGLDRVEREDEAVVEAVQRGVGSRFYEKGRYSPSREQGVHHFHRLLAGKLA